MTYSMGKTSEHASCVSCTFEQTHWTIHISSNKCRSAFILADLFSFILAMAYSELIVDLYSTVFQKQKKKFDVSECDIIYGMADIGKAYAPDPNWEYKGDSPSYYYDDAAHRCAYLHKYAMLHTGLLCDLLEQAWNMSIVNLVFNKGN